MLSERSEINQTQKGKWHGLTKAQESPGSTFLLYPWIGWQEHALMSGFCTDVRDLNPGSDPLPCSASALLRDFCLFVCLLVFCCAYLLFRHRLAQCYICSQCLAYTVAEVCSLGMTSCIIEPRLCYLSLCKYTLTFAQGQKSLNDAALGTKPGNWLYAADRGVRMMPLFW